MCARITEGPTILCVCVCGRIIAEPNLIIIILSRRHLFYRI